MNKYIKGILISALIISPILVFGATQIVKEYKTWDFIASIQTSRGQNVFIYKVDDSSDPNVKCYVMTNDYSLNAISNGANFGISCVVIPKK